MKPWTIREAPKVKTEEGQTTSRPSDKPATLKSRAVDEHVKGKIEVICTTFVIAELIWTIFGITKFKTEQWQAKEMHQSVTTQARGLTNP